MDRLRNSVSQDTEIIDPGEEFVLGCAPISYEYVKEHAGAFNKTYELFADELSRRIMSGYLNSRISGDGSALFPLCTDYAHDYDLELLFSSESEGDIIQCGAYDGRSAIDMDDYARSGHRIIALECDKENFALLQANVSDREHILPLNAGAWDREDVLTMSGSGESAAVTSCRQDQETGGEVRVLAIDSIALNTPVSMISMDIEGAEMQALKGAEQVLRRWKPALAVRVYHKKDDLITIPGWLQDIYGSDSRKFYLRYSYQGSISGNDVTLYVV